MKLRRRTLSAILPSIPKLEARNNDFLSSASFTGMTQTTYCELFPSHHPLSRSETKTFLMMPGALL
jgi:hypothetical protein